jgi:predicted acyltransferase
MILGLIAGRWLQDERPPGDKVRRLVVAGLIGLLAGWLLGVLGICPVVKRIWTPSWTLFSGGWCFLILAAFYAAIDMAGARGWAFPLVVVGTNSIMAYVSEWLFVGFLRASLHTHLPEGFFGMFGEPYRVLVEGFCILGVIWLMLWWMYRKKVFLKI